MSHYAVMAVHGTKCNMCDRSKSKVVLIYYMNNDPVIDGNRFPISICLACLQISMSVAVGGPNYISLDNGRPIGKRQRFEVLKRNGFRCVYCGQKADQDHRLVVDHVEPRAEGGSSEDDNLVAACEDCNQGKGASEVDLKVVPIR
jgi:hypothetical protein